MRLIFICGSLEPGVDGVGDYTRRLATELIKQGHEIAALALDDQFTDKPTDHIENVDTIAFPVYRIPSKLNVDNRFKLAYDWIENFNPEWLSLQFVSFSFHAKGLPFGLSKQLSKFNGRKWHIMFHELWIGMEEKSTLKHIIWGKIQKFLIKTLIKKLNPLLIHTQTKLYQIQLAKLGFNASYLPLFSNIPVDVNFKNKQNLDKSKITLVNFGTIHPTVPIENFTKEAADYKAKTGIQIDMILMGRCGMEQDYWVKIWKSAGLTIHVLGEQPVEYISNIFNTSTLGISTTALPLIEKSGSVAAMHAHNLPVICISNSWKPRGINNLSVTTGVIEYCFGNLESCIVKGNDMEITSIKVSTVSIQLINSLLSLS